MSEGAKNISVPHDWLRPVEPGFPRFIQICSNAGNIGEHPFGITSERKLPESNNNPGGAL